MLNWFKKKSISEGDFLHVSQGLDDFKPNPVSSKLQSLTDQDYQDLCDRCDEEIFREFPEFKRYIDTHPYTCLDSVSLKMRFLDAEEVAEREVRRDLLRSGRELSDEDKKFLTHQRAIELALEAAESDDAIDFAERQAIEQAYQSFVQGDKLDGIRYAIDRSAVAANAIDTMKAHPFLTGFLGGHVILKLKE